MERFARTWLSVSHNLCVVDVELGFAVAPIAVVLEKARTELSGGRAEEDHAHNCTPKNSLHRLINT